MSFTLLALLLAAGPSLAEITPKQLGAPSSDLLNGRLRAPDPLSIGRPSGHAIIPFETDDLGIWTGTVDVPPSHHLSMLPVGVDCSDWTFAVEDPRGRSDGMDWVWTADTLEPVLDQVSTRLDVPDPEPGVWTIRIRQAAPRTEGMLIIRDRLGVGLHFRPEAAATLIGHPIELQAALVTADDGRDPLADAVHTLAVGFDVVRATIQWQTPDGPQPPQTMNRRGPWLAGSFTPVIPGPHRCDLIVEAQSPEGFGFTRTARFLCNVESALQVTGLTTHELDADRLAIDLTLDDPRGRPKLLLGAEVWSGGTGGMRPRCWIGGMSAVSDGRVRLVLDRRWVVREGGTGDQVELRAVRIASPTAAAPLLPGDGLEVLPLGDLVLPPGPVPAVTTAMSQGRGDQRGPLVEPSRATRSSRTDRPGGHNLILSHGYCSDADSWRVGDFTGDVALYMNTYQNFSHDEFAMDLYAFGTQYKSYGIVGHSQGGNAALHLYTFYWSGLDWAGEGRRVQALGTPFSGTTLAGEVSLLGEIFGFGCGINYDMTYDGAAQWLSFIPTAPRQETWTWTSTFEDNWWSYDYCNILTDLLLYDPEDGVVENSAGDLEGANNMGTTVGWCHVKNMAEPREVDDTNRSSEMNLEAAR